MEKPSSLNLAALRAACIAALLSGAAWSGQAQNLVANPGFENGTNLGTLPTAVGTPASGYAAQTGTAPKLTPGQYEVIGSTTANNLFKSPAGNDTVSIAPRTGSFMMAVAGSTTANTVVWEYSVPNTANGLLNGSQWTFSFYAAPGDAGTAGAGANRPAFNVIFTPSNGTATTVSVGAVGSAEGAYSLFTANYTLNTSGATSLKVQIVDTITTGTANNFVLDDLTLVPEAGTTAAGVALAGLGAVAWIRSRRATAQVA